MAENLSPVNMSANRGMNSHATAIALSKQLLMQCDPPGNITLPKETLKIILHEFIGAWQNQQIITSASFKKVTQ